MNKLAIFTDSYAPQISGVARRYELLVDNIAGYSEWETVQLHAPNYGHGYVESTATEIFYTGKPWKLSPNILWCKPDFKAALRKTARFNPSVIHIATEGPIGQVGKHIAMHLGIPFTIASHTDYISYLPKYKLPKFLAPLGWRYLKHFYSGAEYVIVPSQWHRDYLLKNLGDLNYRVWNYGVESSYFKFRSMVGPAEPEIINLLYVGRLAPEKNLQWVVDAWNALGHQKNLRLTIVGSGNVEPLKAMNHWERVFVTGPLRGDALIEQYQKGDIFLCPSETETFGNVVAEAGMAGNMVVTSGKGAARYVLPTTAFPCARQKDFTEVIETFVNNPRKMYEMQHETQKEAKSLYSIETFVTSFTDALDGATI